MQCQGWNLDQLHAKQMNILLFYLSSSLRVNLSTKLVGAINDSLSSNLTSSQIFPIGHASHLSFRLEKSARFSRDCFTIVLIHFKLSQNISSASRCGLCLLVLPMALSSSESALSPIIKAAFEGPGEQCSDCHQSPACVSLSRICPGSSAVCNPWCHVEFLRTPMHPGTSKHHHQQKRRRQFQETWKLKSATPSVNTTPRSICMNGKGCPPLCVLRSSETWICVHVCECMHEIPRYSKCIKERRRVRPFI